MIVIEQFFSAFGHYFFAQFFVFILFNFELIYKFIVLYLCSNIFPFILCKLHIVICLFLQICV
jgi:hypothetical protein